MKFLLAIVLIMLLCGCTVRPFGFAPWVIVMPGARLSVVVGSKSEDHRIAGESDIGTPVSIDKKEIKKVFVPPKMGK